MPPFVSFLFRRWIHSLEYLFRLAVLKQDISAQYEALPCLYLDLFARLFRDRAHPELFCKGIGHRLHFVGSCRRNLDLNLVIRNNDPGINEGISDIAMGYALAVVLDLR